MLHVGTRDLKKADNGFKLLKFTIFFNETHKMGVLMQVTQKSWIKHKSQERRDFRNCLHLVKCILSQAKFQHCKKLQSTLPNTLFKKINHILFQNRFRDFFICFFTFNYLKNLEFSKCQVFSGTFQNVTLFAYSFPINGLLFFALS